MKFKIDQRRSEAGLDPKIAVVQDKVPVEKDEVKDRVLAVPCLPVGVIKIEPVGLRAQDGDPAVREKVPVST